MESKEPTPSQEAIGCATHAKGDRNVYKCIKFPCPDECERAGTTKPEIRKARSSKGMYREFDDRECMMNTMNP